ncbi:MAG: histidine--tRNA ligase [Rickettsiales bacterium]|nr:histidine--tRNA ligase [Rickettsiales bacterium]
MRDLFGDSIRRHNIVVEKAKRFAALYNFKELQLPILEFSEIFERNLGETSDVVMKEIYKFQDKSNNFLSLRPEFTAGVVRAILTNQELRENLPLKLFSFGAVFRYDRPQKGRYRQFSQVNFEYFGNGSYLAEVEVLQMANGFLSSLGLNNIKLEINSLGCSESRSKYEVALREYFEKYRSDLSEYSQIRLEKNVLRILDSKEERDQKLLLDMPKLKDFYTLDDKEFFSCILNKLELLHIKYHINPKLVRGLDYYTSIVFEFTTSELEAQPTVLAGGRYDSLFKNMGGAKETPAIGFAAGIDRLMLLLKDTPSEIPPVALISIGEKELDHCLKLQNMLRNNHLNIECFFTGKMKQKLSAAVKTGCKYAMIIGEEEVIDKKIVIKNLGLGEEKKIKEEDVITFLKNITV